MKREDISKMRNKYYHEGNHDENKICVTPLTCYQCFKNINALRLKEAQELVYNLKSTSLCTIINIEINPTMENLEFYSFNGIEQLVSRFINYNNTNLANNFKNNPIWIQTYFTENKIFNIPILQIQIIFDWELEESYCDNMFSTCMDLYCEHKLITHDIDFVSVNDFYDEPELFISYFYKQPILGFNSFCNTRHLSQITFSNVNEELDKIFSSKIIKLDEKMFEQETGRVKFMYDASDISKI